MVNLITYMYLLVSFEHIPVDN